MHLKELHSLKHQMWERLIAVSPVLAPISHLSIACRIKLCTCFSCLLLKNRLYTRKKKKCKCVFPHALSVDLTNIVDLGLELEIWHLDWCTPSFNPILLEHATWLWQCWQRL